MKTTRTSSSTLGTSDGMHYDYFTWLCQKVERRQDTVHSRELAALLNSIEYRGYIPNDDNRVGDGLALRERYCQERQINTNTDVLGPCTVLEMMIALAERIDAILADRPDHYQVQKWFWEMCDNLGLRPFDEEANRRIVEAFVDRQYSRNGKGGLFPLKSSPFDQRKVEVWRQFMAYVQENYPD